MKQTAASQSLTHYVTAKLT